MQCPLCGGDIWAFHVVEEEAEVVEEICREHGRDCMVYRLACPECGKDVDVHMRLDWIEEV